MKLSYNNVLGLVTTIALTTVPGCLMTPTPAVSATVPSERGFVPNYIGTGTGTAFGEDGEVETEAAILGAYRTPGSDSPITVRGAIYPKDTVETQVSLTYDFPVGRNTNLFVGPGMMGGDKLFYPSVGLGLEHLFSESNVVAFTGYDVVFMEEGQRLGLVKAGMAYQF